MQINKEWAMPNSNTFLIKPIKLLLEKYTHGNLYGVDPFGGNNSPATVTNDLNPACQTEYHMDAVDFLRSFSSESVDYVLFDPPYSPRQVAECYKKLSLTVNMETTQATF